MTMHGSMKRKNERATNEKADAGTGDVLRTERVWRVANATVGKLRRGRTAATQCRTLEITRSRGSRIHLVEMLTRTSHQKG